MSTVDPSGHEAERQRLGRVMTAGMVLSVLVFLLAPFAFSLFRSRLLEVLFWIGWGIVLVLTVWGTLLGHRITGRWGPRMGSTVLSGERGPSPRPMPLEQPIFIVGDLLTSWFPFSPRVDLVIRPSGLVFVRRRLGRTPVRRAALSARRRMAADAQATLQDLLEADPWNRFVPWKDLTQVRFPGFLSLKRIKFTFADGTRRILWATVDKSIEAERALSDVLG